MEKETEKEKNMMKMCDFNDLNEEYVDNGGDAIGKKYDDNGKILFSYVNLKQKFEILKHNKSLQNAININNRHYQLFSGRYIIYEENGEVKEYEGNTDELVYEGEYLNGKRNGKGKEYYNNDELKFEGEYL